MNFWSHCDLNVTLPWKTLCRSCIQYLSQSIFDMCWLYAWSLHMQLAGCSMGILFFKDLMGNTENNTHSYWREGKRLKGTLFYSLIGHAFLILLMLPGVLKYPSWHRKNLFLILWSDKLSHCLLLLSLSHAVFFSWCILILIGWGSWLSLHLVLLEVLSH